MGHSSATSLDRKSQQNAVRNVRRSYFWTISIAVALCFFCLNPLAIVFACIVLGAIAVSTYVTTAPRTIRSLIGLQFVLAVFLSLPIYNWPMRVRFALSKRAVERFVAESSEDSSDPGGVSQDEFPKRCGLFVVQRVERFSGQTWLIIANHPSGPSGLLYHPDRMPAPMNESVGIQLGPEWRYTWMD
ncbi:MAG: hypothetical protein AAF497_28595 [Planctomycetota bacterium]